MILDLGLSDGHGLDLLPRLTDDEGRDIPVTDGRRFRILTVIDNYGRECLGLIADTSLSGWQVARELAAIILRRGRAETIISDNGTEYTSNAILLGPMTPAWLGITSRRESRSRTASKRASMADCVTSC